jgi:hypothetical protein
MYTMNATKTSNPTVQRGAMLGPTRSGSVCRPATLTLRVITL